MLLWPSLGQGWGHRQSRLCQHVLFFTGGTQPAFCVLDVSRDFGLKPESVTFLCGAFN